MKIGQNVYDIIYELLGPSAINCCDLECNNCSFDSNGYCGLVVIRNIMRKLAGADGTTQSMTDEQLIDFIKKNPERRVKL